MAAQGNNAADGSRRPSAREAHWIYHTLIDDDDRLHFDVLINEEMGDPTFVDRMWNGTPWNRMMLWGLRARYARFTVNLRLTEFHPPSSQVWIKRRPRRDDEDPEAPAPKALKFEDEPERMPL